MKIIQFSLFVLTILFLHSGCQNDPEVEGAATYIPAGSTNVVSFDLQRLMQKADFSSVKEMDFYKDMQARVADKNSTLARVLEDPAESGIDLNDRIYVSTELNKDDPEVSCTRIIIPLRDAAKFESLIAASELEVSNENGLKLAHPEQGMTLAWNDEVFTVSLSSDPNWNAANRNAAWMPDEKEHSLASNDNFKKAMASPHDMAGWMTANSIAGNPAAGMALSMIDVDAEALKDNYIHYYGDFEPGQMRGHADFFINRTLGNDVIGRFFREEGATDFSKVLPSENLTFAMTTAIHPTGIDKFLSERPQSKEYADFVLNDIGLKRKEIIDIFNGDVMMAAYGNRPMGDGSILLAFRIKDMDKAKAFLQEAVEKKKLKVEDENLYRLVSIGGENFSITINKGLGKLLLKDDLLIYAPDENLLLQIRDENINPVSENADWMDMNDQTMTGWMNLQTIQQDMGGIEGNLFKEMRFNINDEGGDFLLKTADADENSLQTILKMIERSYHRKAEKNLEVM